MFLMSHPPTPSCLLWVLLFNVSAWACCIQLSLISFLAEFEETHITNSFSLISHVYLWHPAFVKDTYVFLCHLYVLWSEKFQQCRRHKTSLNKVQSEQLNTWLYSVFLNQYYHLWQISSFIVMKMTKWKAKHIHTIVVTNRLVVPFSFIIGLLPVANMSVKILCEEHTCSKEISVCVIPV